MESSMSKAEKGKSRKHWVVWGQRSELHVQVRLAVRAAAGEKNERSRKLGDACSRQEALAPEL